VLRISIEETLEQPLFQQGSVWPALHQQRFMGGTAAGERQLTGVLNFDDGLPALIRHDRQGSCRLRSLAR
jgi:hypothetical protein